MRQGGRQARLATIADSTENWIVQEQVKYSDEKDWGCWIGMVKDAVPNRKCHGCITGRFGGPLISNRKSKGHYCASPDLKVKEVKI